MRRDFVLIVFSCYFLTNHAVIDFDHGDCPQGWLDCKNGRCVAMMWLCDGEDDCGNEKDESNCPEHKHQVCKNYQFSCGDFGPCIPQTWMCDGHRDCPDGSDERACVNGTSCVGFQCNNFECIPEKWQCDGQRDCTDNSDERNCNASETTLSCKKEHFTCNTGECIDIKKVCNLQKDCPKGEDEGKHCHDEACKNSTCSQNCHSTPSGPKCFCLEGYTLADDGTSCLDVNECEAEERHCSQTCHNTKGSFICSCEHGYSLKNDTICLADGPEPLLLFVDTKEVRGIWLHSQRYFPVTKTKHQAVGVSYDSGESKVYWVEFNNNQGVIYSVGLDGASKQVVISKGLQQPEDIAVDWLGRNLYITELALQQLIVCKLDGSICHTLFDDLDHPRAIALDPASGLIYWTDWGVKPAIFRAGMDGSERTTFLDTNLGWPNGLTLDMATKRLYWSDGLLKSIEFATLDGKFRQVVLQDNIFHPFSMAVFEDTLYWSDWHHYTLDSCNKFNGRSQKTFIRESSRQIMGVHVYHPVLLSQARNPCWASQCSHLCLVAPKSRYTCACPAGMTLGDRRTCIPKENAPFLLAAEEGTLYHVQPESVGENIVTRLPVSQIATVGDVTYDWDNRVLFVSDLAKRSILAINDSYHTDVLVNEHLDSVEGLDFDWMGHNLYWVDAGEGKIEVLAIKKKARRTIIEDLVRPMDLVLHPTKGVMYIVTTGLTPSIILCHMDGTDCRTLVSENLGAPVAITLSIWQDRLFWADARLGAIDSTNLKGESRARERAHVGHVMDASISFDYLYWTDMDTHSIYYAKTLPKSEYSVITLPDDHNGSAIIKIKYFTPPPSQRVGGCAIRNGGCSHICLSSPLGNTCTCPWGMSLKSSLTCELEEKCLEYEFSCDNKCLPSYYQCDGTEDCSDGSDEKNCDSSECPAGDFRCTNGHCILISWRCDFKDDCGDNSDESNCTKNVTCANDTFTCGQGQCVPHLWVCDGDKDCANGQDEMLCDKNECDANQFKCANGSCVPLSWRCDGEPDCRDESDELKCGLILTCGAADFQCANGMCLDKKLVCDHRRDCEDGSDEDNCTTVETTCGSGYFSCDDGTCIYTTEACDSYNDCPDGEDEKSLKCEIRSCERYEFYCQQNEKCIPINWLCDGQDDCGDKEDELLPKCIVPSSTVAPPKVENCPDFTCLSGECVLWKNVCDSIPDCFDRSDEGSHCGDSCWQNNGGCAQKCRNTPFRAVCSCEEGYVLLSDLKTCEDTNECAERGFCSHYCNNTKGGFKCSCADGYSLASNQRTCKANGDVGSIIYLLQHQLRALTLEGHSEHIMYEDPKMEIRGFDYDDVEKVFYLADSKQQCIFKIIPGLPHEKVVTDIEHPHYLSFDWVGQNLYFTNGPGNITACTTDGKYCTTLVRTGYRDIHSLALAPVSGLMFWSIWNSMINRTSGRIERSNMDGSSKTILVSEKTSWPSSLTVDDVLHRIYWTDLRLSIIEVVAFDGNHREKIVSEGIVHPFSLTMFEDFLFWSDWGTDTIVKSDKFTGRDRFPLHRGDVKAYVMKILHPVMQRTGSKQCLNKCNQLCLVRPGGHTCRCSHNFVMSADKTSCLLKEIPSTIPPPILSRRRLVCPNNYCQNKGECIAHENGLECRCKPDYLGAKCQTKAEEIKETDYSWITGVVLGLLFVILVLAATALFCRRHSKHLRRFGNTVSISFKNPMFGMKGDEGREELMLGRDGVYRDVAAAGIPVFEPTTESGSPEELRKWNSRESVEMPLDADSQLRDGSSLSGRGREKLVQFFKHL